MKGATQTWLISFALESVQLSFAFSISVVGWEVKKLIDRKGAK